MNQEKAQKQFHKKISPSLLDEARAALYVVQDGLIRFVNQQFCDALGYKKPDELIGRPFPDLIYPDDLSLVKSDESDTRDKDFPVILITGTLPVSKKNKEANI